MKTTLDLPADLVREIKLRAVREGRKLKDLVPTLLKAGLAAEKSRGAGSQARKGSIPLPLFACDKDAPARRMTMAEIAKLEQQVEAQEDLARINHPL